MSLAAVLVVVALTSALPAIAITDDGWLAVGVGPLLFALAATVAGVVATALRVNVLVPFVPVVVATNVVALRALRQRHRSPQRRLGLSGAVIGLAAAYGLLPLRAPRLDWDTRTHWFGSASWFLGGGDYVWRAITNPVWGHRDYPPLIGATVGTMWRLQDHVDLRSGQIMVGILNFGALVLIGLALPRLFPRLGVVPTAIGAALVLAAYGYAGPYATDGYVDLLTAASMTAGVLYLLVAPPRRVDVLIGVTAIAVAGLSKNEGTIIALTIGLLACWRHRRRLPELRPLLAALPLVLVWPIFVRLRGVHGDYSHGDVTAFLRGDAQLWKRVWPTMRGISRLSIGVVLVAAICSVLGHLAAGDVRPRAGIGSTAGVWLTSLVSFLVVVSAYVLERSNLTNHLASSADRTTIGLRLLLLTETACWTMCGLSALTRRSVHDPDETRRPRRLPRARDPGRQSESVG